MNTLILQRKDLILFGYRGSIAHNLYIPPSEPCSTDDTDYIGIFINDKDHYFGMKTHDHEEIFEGKDDIVLYELKKFARLLCKSNPNVISFLFNDKALLKESIVGTMLLDKRDWFLTKEIYSSFKGYAQNQMSKMVKGAYKGYMGEKRKKLVQKYGYDIKNASHLIRLLTMCLEVLSEGKMTVWQSGHQREYLLAIKKGQWAMEKVEREAKYLFQAIDEAYAVCPLPEKVNTDAVNELLVNMFEEYFYNEGIYRSVSL